MRRFESYHPGQPLLGFDDPGEAPDAAPAGGRAVRLDGPTEFGLHGAAYTVAARRAKTPPAIDGILDDPVWREAPSVTGFRTWTPDFGLTMVGETTVHAAYDGENLYFAFRCYDP